MKSGKGYAVKAIGFVLAFILSLSLFAVGGAKVAAADLSTVYVKNGAQSSELTSGADSSVATNGAFTVKFYGSWTAQTGVTYVLSLENASGTGVNFPKETYFDLIDFGTGGAGKSKIYRYSNASAENNIDVADFTYGGATFSAGYTAGQTANEALQFSISLPSSSTLTAGSYKIKLTRKVNGASSAVWSKALTFSAVSTQFTVSAAAQNSKLYTQTNEIISVNIKPNGALDTSLSQKGRGVRVSFVGATGIPQDAKVELFNGTTASAETKVGDDWGKTKRFAFNTTAESNICLSLNIPYNVIADGKYSLKIELFVEETAATGESTMTIVGSTTVEINLLNVNYKLRAQTAINRANTLNFGVVFTSKETGTLCFVISESLPDDAKVTYGFEHRTKLEIAANGAHNETWESAVSESAQMTITAFRAQKLKYNSAAGKYVLASELSATQEGVYRLYVKVFDRNGELQTTAYANVVLVVSAD